MTALAKIVERHVDACVAELRAAVEAEIAQAIHGLVQAHSEPKARAKRGGRGRAAAPRDRRGKSKRIEPSKARAEEQPPQPVKRSTSPSPPKAPHTCSECDQPGHNARTCPQVRAVAPPVDAARAARFAAIEASAAKRNGAAA